MLVMERDGEEREKRVRARRRRDGRRRRSTQWRVTPWMKVIIAFGWLVIAAESLDEEDLDRMWAMRKGVEAEMMVFAVQVSMWAEELWCEYADAGVKYRP